MGLERKKIYMYMYGCVCVYIYIYIYIGFPVDSEYKEYACNVGDPCSIPGSGRSPGEGNSYPLQYSRYICMFR